MNILCFGKNGQVASALSNVFTEARFISSAECDFNFSFRVKVFLEDLKDLD